MPRIDRTPLAKIDAAEIWYNIAQDNEAAADRLIDQFDERIQLLAHNPLMRESVEYIRPDVRRSTLSNYLDSAPSHFVAEFARIQTVCDDWRTEFLRIRLQGSLHNYVIDYKPVHDGIQVVRILHGARQHEDLV